MALIMALCFALVQVFALVPRGKFVKFQLVAAPWFQQEFQQDLPATCCCGLGSNRSMAAWMTGFGRSAEGPFPLKVQAQGDHLVEKDGTPFYFAADTHWPLLWHYTYEEAVELIDMRAALGFTAISASLVPFSNEKNAYGDQVFLNYGTFAPNPAYFERAGAIVDYAKQKGLAVYLVMLWWNVVKNPNGPYWRGAEDQDNCFHFGIWLGSQWKQHHNLLWALGGDSCPNHDDDPSSDEHMALIDSLVKGLRTGGAQQLLTYHSGGGAVPSEGRSSLTCEPVSKASWLQFVSRQSAERIRTHACTHTHTQGTLLLARPMGQAAHSSSPPTVRSRLSVASQAWQVPRRPKADRCRLPQRPAA